jgi:hypothetical protein
VQTLWDVLRAKGTADQVAKIEKLVADAAGLLDLVRDTFPTYTLHNHVHAENVVDRMTDLLGDRVGDLSALESAILLLSAYFHDIGMVYSAEERQAIRGESAFDEYLRDHPEEYLRHQANPDDESVIEGYCRARHAIRVYEFLDPVDDWLTWGSVSLRRHLGAVCKSHNDNADSLGDDRFDTEFLGSCDLRFCAILLRLADILDFDNSRSPDSVYQYLGLERRTTRRTAASDVEWRKHLHSDGFVFPTTRPPEYAIKLVAGPDHPAVESDVRAFLDTIEGELAACQRLLRTCSDRWSTLPLPGRVDRRNIVSKGYVFGDFRFKLDRHAVLDLFMGENLYSDPSVFVRELLQNSIDATRSRAKLQHHDPVAEGWEIHLTDWHDHEGYQWIRIDDNGSGMNQHIVENYLLRIGKSYYSSPEFQAELHRHCRPGERPLVSIGKFGVGLLSCFMLADQVELTTLRTDANGTLEKPLRMSFHHVADYSFLQTPDERATPFPGKYGSSPGYRTTPGTSIAVRIDPRRHGSPLDLTKLCHKHLLGTRVPVKVNDTPFLDGTAASDKSKWSRERMTLPIKWDFKALETWWEPSPKPQLHDRLKEALASLTAEVTPLDFGQTESDSPADLDGVGVLVTVDTSPIRELLLDADLSQAPAIDDVELGSLPAELITAFKERLGNFQFVHMYVAGELASIHLELYPDNLPSFLERMATVIAGQPGVEAEQAAAQLRDLHDRIGYNTDAHRRCRVEGSIDWRAVLKPGIALDHLRSWSHNGVRLPLSDSLPSTQDGSPWIERSRRVDDDEDSGSIGCVYGSIWLTDELRPGLNIARNQVRATPFCLYSSINLRIRRSLTAHARSHIVDQLKDNAVRYVGDEWPEWRMAETLSDPLMLQADGWVAQPVVQLTTGEFTSILDIRRIVARSGRCELRWPSYTGTDRIVANLLHSLLLAHLDIAVATTTGQIAVRSATLPSLDPRLNEYPASTFLPYEDGAEDVLVVIQKIQTSSTVSYNSQVSPNVHHALIKWFLEVGPTLRRRAPALERAFLTAAGEIEDKARSTDPFSELRKVVDQIGQVVASNGGQPFGGELNSSCIKFIQLDDIRNDEGEGEDPEGGGGDED